MKGLELCESFYRDFGESLIKENFSHISNYIAVGLTGSGSECLGYDDEISRDHDFQPGFCIFIPCEDIIDSKTAFLLERAYNKLPKEYMSFPRQNITPVGGSRHGVIRTSEFFLSKTGSENGELSLRGWLETPEHYLLEATNGRIFCDNYGEVTKIRKSLAYYPEDIRLKKLAGNLLIMAQSGQYNYPRSLKRGDTAAARMSAAEFVRSCLNTVYLLNKKYTPYYKWVFRGLRDLDPDDIWYSDLEALLSLGKTEGELLKGKEIIEKLCCKTVKILELQSLTGLSGSNLEAHAYSVNDFIRDPQVRNLSIFAGV